MPPVDSPPRSRDGVPVVVPGRPRARRAPAGGVLRGVPAVTVPAP